MRSYFPEIDTLKHSPFCKFHFVFPFPPAFSLYSPHAMLPGPLKSVLAHQQLLTCGKPVPFLTGVDGNVRRYALWKGK